MQHRTLRALQEYSKVPCEYSILWVLSERGTVRWEYPSSAVRSPPPAPRLSAVERAHAVVGGHVPLQLLHCTRCNGRNNAATVATTLQRTQQRCNGATTRGRNNACNDATRQVCAPVRVGARVCVCGAGVGAQGLRGGRSPTQALRSTRPPRPPRGTPSRTCGARPDYSAYVIGGWVLPGTAGYSQHCRVLTALCVLTATTRASPPHGRPERRGHCGHSAAAATSFVCLCACLLVCLSPHRLSCRALTRETVAASASHSAHSSAAAALKAKQPSATAALKSKTTVGAPFPATALRHPSVG